MTQDTMTQSKTQVELATPQRENVDDNPNRTSEPEVIDLTVAAENDSPLIKSEDSLRRSGRIKKKPTRFTFDEQHGYLAVKCYLRKMSYTLRS